MFLFICFLILAVTAGFVFAASWAAGAKKSEERTATRVGASVVLFISFIFLFFASTTMVGTKKVAVLTVAGKPSGHLSNGWHLKAPWAKPHEIDAAVQTNTYASDNGDDQHKQGGATDTCVHVRIERQATACVNVSIRWQIKESGVDYLYRNYKDNGAITDNVVLRDLQTALNEQFTTYDPLTVDANGQNTNKLLPSYADAVKTEIAKQISEWIDVQSVVIPIINYDTDTQSKVHQLLQQIAQTRVAEQQEQTNKAQAKANDALTKSVNGNPAVLTDKCLNILKEAVDKGQSIVGAPSCFPGSTSAGVLVGGNK